MTVYRYNLGELEETRGNLDTLHSDFSAASSAREGAADDMGYGSLRGAIQEFTNNWKHNREKQLESIAGARDTLGTICTNYADFDSGAADDLLAET